MQFVWVHAVGSRSRRFYHPLSIPAAEPASTDSRFARLDSCIAHDFQETSDALLELLGLTPNRRQQIECEDIAPTLNLIQGLLLFAPGLLHDTSDPASILHPLSPQQELVMRYFRHVVRNDGEDSRIQFLRVVEWLPVRSPCAPLTAEIMGPTRHQFFEINQIAVNRLLKDVVEDGCSSRFAGQPMRTAIDSIAQQHGLDAPRSSELTVTMGSPGVHALLLVYGHWQSYCFLAPPAIGSLNTYTNARLIERLLAFEIPKRCNPEQFPVDSLADIVDDSMTLRDIAEGLKVALQGQQLGLQDSVRYAHMITWLEKAYDESRGNRRSVNTEVIKRTWQWRIAFLLKHVMLSMEMKRSYDFNRVLRMSLITILPKIWANTFLHMLDVVPRPKRSTLYMHRLTLHVGYLLYRRAAYLETSQMGDIPKVFSYISCDASPQGKRDWLLCYLCTVPKAKAVDLYMSVRHLWLQSQEHGVSASIEEQGKHLDSLTRFLSWRVLTPVCIGSGRASARHKMKALTWALMLEIGWESTAEMLSGADYLTDFGTESKLAFFECFNLKDFFPWLRGPDGSGDADADADDHGFQFGWAGSAADNDGAGGGGDDPAQQEDAGFDFDWHGSLGPEDIPQAQLDEDPSFMFDYLQAPPPIELDSESMGHADSRESIVASDASQGDEMSVSDDGMQVDPLDVDTRACLHVPGLQHIVSNATDCLGNSMAQWKTWVTSLKGVSKLLRRTFSKERLEATCFSEEPASLEWPAVKSYSGDVVDGRWASITDAAAQLCPLETILRYAWSLDKFNFYKNGVPMNLPHNEYRVDSSAVDTTIGSDFFWCYTFMVSLMAGIIHHLMFWVMGCPCHRSSKDYHDLARQARASSCSGSGSAMDVHKACPMAGRRAAEIAAGEFSKMLDEMWNWYSAALRMDRRVRLLQPEEVALLLADAANGRLAFMFYVKMKIAPFMQLPLATMGVAALDWDVARRAALYCLQLFDSDTHGADHPVAHMLCHKLRDQLDAFIRGGDPEPKLMLFMARCRFEMINEGPTEGLHSIIKHGLASAPHFGPLHVALLQHYKPISDLCWSGTDSLKDFANMCEKVRTGERCIEHLGIREHPAIRALLDTGISTAQLSRDPYRKTVVKAIYHCDLETLYEDLSEAPGPKPLCTLAAPKLARSFEVAEGFDKFLLGPMRQHVRALLALHADMKLLIKLSDFPHGFSFVQSWADTVGDASMLSGGFNMGGVSGSTPCRDDPFGKLSWLGMTPVYATPSSLVLSGHSQVNLDNTCIAVSYHAVHEHDGIHAFELDSLFPEHHILVLDAMGVSALQSIYFARPKKELGLALVLDDREDIPLARQEQMRKVLQSMSDAGAGPAGLRYIPGGSDRDIMHETELLETMMNESLVSEAPGSLLMARSWQMTTLGLSVVRQTVLMSAPEPALAVRKDIDPDVMTFHELFFLLGSKGFTKHFISRSDQFLSKNMPAYDPANADTKDVYINPKGAPRRFYLLALAMGKFVVKHGLSDRSFLILFQIILFYLFYFVFNLFILFFKNCLSDRSYKLLCQGKEENTRARRKSARSSGFRFMGEGLSIEGAEADGVHRGRGRRGRGRGRAAHGEAREGRARGRGRGRGRCGSGSVAAAPEPLEEDFGAPQLEEGDGDVVDREADDGGDSLSSDLSRGDLFSTEEEDDFNDGDDGDDDLGDRAGLHRPPAEPLLADIENSAGFEEDLAGVLDEDLVPEVEPLDGGGDDSGAEIPQPPSPPVPGPPAAHPHPFALDDDTPLLALLGEEPRAWRGPRTVDKYPRLTQRPESETPDGKFHGLRCVVNPLLRGGKWDSMRAICAFHGIRCEASKTLLASVSRRQQGRVKGIMWTWLATAEDFPDKESHCKAADPRKGWHGIQALKVRSAARRMCEERIDAIPEMAIREFWKDCERPPWPEEGPEPNECP